jgi:uncharacterized coiled-coil protein SlyX
MAASKGEQAMNLHLQEIESLSKSLKEREKYVTELENRLRALWDKLEGERNYYTERINRLAQAGDCLLSHRNSTDYHEKVREWDKAKKDKP